MAILGSIFGMFVLFLIFSLTSASKKQLKDGNKGNKAGDSEVELSSEEGASDLATGEADSAVHGSTQLSDDKVSGEQGVSDLATFRSQLFIPIAVPNASIQLDQLKQQAAQGWQEGDNKVWSEEGSTDLAPCRSKLFSLCLFCCWHSAQSNPRSSPRMTTRQKKQPHQEMRYIMQRVCLTGHRWS